MADPRLLRPFNLWSHRFAVVMQGLLLVVMSRMDAHGVTGLGPVALWSAGWMLWSYGKLRLHHAAVKADKRRTIQA